MPTLLYVATLSHTIRHFLLPYAAHFRALGWQVDAAGSGAGDDAALEAAFNRVFDLPLTRSIRDVGGMVRGERAIAAVLATRPDIVHVHTPIAAFLTRLAARRMRQSERPLIAYTAHGFHFHEGGARSTNFAFRTAEQIAGRWTDRLIVINAEDFRAARKHHLVPADRLVRMPGIGVDTDLYSPRQIAPEARAAARDELGLDAGVPYFALVGELNRNKRSADILHALGQMRHREAHLAILGDGPERPKLEQLGAELGLMERVHFVGHVPDVRPFVGDSAALILASQREGLARSIMEALALEVPVIASTARGNAELVGEDSGFVVPTGETLQFGQRMDWLLEHPDQAHAMGVRGRERMIESFDLRELIRLHEALYLAMLERRSKSTARTR